MSEHIIRFLLSEIKTVRVVCKKCGAVIETPIEKAGDALASGRRCRFCNNDLGDPNHPNSDPLRGLAAVAESLTSMENVEVHFVFPGD